jgi:hypothetical protein
VLNICSVGGQEYCGLEFSPARISEIFCLEASTLFREVMKLAQIAFHNYSKPVRYFHLVGWRHAGSKESKDLTATCMARELRHMSPEPTTTLTPEGPNSGPGAWNSGRWFYIFSILTRGIIGSVGVFLLIEDFGVSERRICCDLQKTPSKL